MPRLAGKVALVTGGGAGIGAACADVFCAEGADVLLVDRSADALRSTADDLRKRHRDARVEVFCADVADEGRAALAVDAALAGNGRLDILVNNAAARHHGPVGEASAAAWQAIVGVNLVGTAQYCKAALPALRASGSGRIVNVSSCYAVTGRRGMGLYDATKAGLLALTRTLAFEEAEHGVRVNAVCPGSTLTEFHVARAHASGKDIQTLAGERTETSLLRRWATPDEIAWPILWLASDEASFITGTTLMVDGGLHVM